MDVSTSASSQVKRNPTPFPALRLGRSRSQCCGFIMKLQSSELNADFRPRLSGQAPGSYFPTAAGRARAVDPAIPCVEVGRLKQSDCRVIISLYIYTALCRPDQVLERCRNQTPMNTFPWYGTWRKVALSGREPVWDNDSDSCTPTWAGGERTTA